MVKLYTLFTNLLNFEHSSSFLSAGFFLKFIWQGISSFFNAIVNGIMNLAWTLIKCVLGIMEALEFMITEFLGLDTSVNDVYTFVKDSDGGTEVLRVFSKTLRAMIAVSIVLLIVFTIIAIIRQEYKNAFTGMKQGNDKKTIIAGMFKKMLYVLLLPLTMMFIITAVNSILTAFARAFQGGENLTIAAQLLSSSTYDSNKYRYYAEQNKRVPIIVKAYDPDKYDYDENDKLIEEIKKNDIQSTLRNVATNMTSGDLLKFKESVIYKNNKISNSVEYDKVFEKFVCTAEQYQVMADFIDYAQKHNLPFQIKSIDDQNIDWKYVDSAVFNPSDVSLKINYRDASDINGNGKTNDSYTMEYSSSFEVTTPVQDALKSIMALLGIDEYSDNLFKTMDRDENYVNVVDWQSEKVWIQLTGKKNVTFDFANPETWSRLDQLIIYEYYHFSSNNTFGNYTINDLQNGIELDASKITYREYYAEAHAYGKEKTLECVKINGSYYNVQKDESKRDAYGNIYYVLKDALQEGEVGEFLNPEYSTIIEDSSAKTVLKFIGNGTNNFNINDPSTWAYSDQIILYEYYRNLSFNNTLYRYNIEDFYGDGIELPVYDITEKEIKINNGVVETIVSSPVKYALINGIYYQVTQDSGNKYKLYCSAGNFLTETNGSSFESYYMFDANFGSVDYTNKYGISSTEDSIKSFILEEDKVKLDGSNNTVIDGTAVGFTHLTADDTAAFEKYSSFSLKLSENFNYQEVDTWTYRDYFVFYLYIKYPGVVGRLGLESLKVSGLNGNIVKLNSSSKYAYQVKIGNYLDGGQLKDRYLYLDMDATNEISTMLINNVLDVLTTKQNNYLDGPGNILFRGVTNNDLVSADSENYIFNFSQDFQMNNPYSWTVMDYILYSLCQENKVKTNIGTVENIQDNGYAALMYKIYSEGSDYANTGDRVLEEVLYKFGKNDSKYLSRNQIMSLKNKNGECLNFKGVSDLERMNLLDFVVKIKAEELSSFITDKEGIIDVLYNELSGNIYSSDAIISSILKNDAFKFNSSIEIYNNVEQYTYSNPDVKFEDLSTWTALDALIYLKEGTVYQNYTSNVVTDGTEKYFVIGEWAVNITTSGKFTSTLTNSKEITSQSIGKITDNYENYYNNNGYSKYVYDESYFENKEVIKYSASDFVFKKETENDEASVFEIIYNTFNNALQKEGTVSCQAYYVNDEIFIKIENTKSTPTSYKYIKVGTNSTDDIAVSSNSKLELVNNNKIATKTIVDDSDPENIEYDSYSAFEFDLNENGVIDNGESVNYSKLDAIILNDSQNLTKREFTKFKLGSSIYIYTGRRYIKINDLLSDTINLNTNAITSTEVDNLYSIYSSNASNNVGGVYEESQKRVIKYTFKPGNYITDLSPIAIILAKSGFLNLKFDDHGILSYDGSEKNEIIEGTILENSKGVYFYLEDDVNDNVVYIKINDIGHIEKVDENSYTLSDNQTVKYQMVNSYITISPSFSWYELLNTELSDVGYNVSSTIDGVTKLELSNTENFSISDSTTWSIYNILYYYLTDSTNVAKDYLRYTDESGNKYINIKTKNDQYFIKINDDTFKDKITTLYTKEAINPTFSLNDANGNYSALGIIGYKQTGTKTGDVPYISFRTLSDWTTIKKFYYFTNAYLETNTAVYGLTEKSLINKTSTISHFIKFAGGEPEDENGNRNTQTNINNWDVLDFLIAYASGSSYDARINSNMYVFGENAYLLINGSYLNITKFKNLIKVDFTKIESDETISNGSAFSNIIVKKLSDSSEFNKLYLESIPLKTGGTTLKYTKTTKSGVKTVFEVICSLAGVNFVENETKEFEVYYDKITHDGYIKVVNSYIAGDDYYVKVNDSVRLMSNEKYAEIYFDESSDKVYDLFGTSSIDGKNIFNIKTSDGSPSQLIGNSADKKESVDKVYFSEGFVAGDYSTWTVSDFVLYYLFVEHASQFQISGNTSSVYNFQKFINQGYIPAKDYKYIVEDKFGNAKLTDVLLISIDTRIDPAAVGMRNFEIVTKDLFESYYAKYIRNIAYVEKNANEIKLNYSDQLGSQYNNKTPDKFYVTRNVVLNAAEFIYENYYRFYYITDTNVRVIDQTGIYSDIDASLKNEILNGTAKNEGIINFKLSENFDIKDISTWTALDLLVVLEYSRENVRHNYFEGIEFKDLKKDNYMPYFKTSKGEICIEINGYFYNLSKIDANIDEIENGKKTIDGKTVDLLIAKTTSENSEIKTLFETIKFNAKADIDRYKDLSKTPESILYQYDGGTKTNYMTLNKNLVDNYNINITKLNTNGHYAIDKIIRIVNWPQKLMNDLQVIYPDLNWSTLIATDGWLDMLGEFTSAHSSGEFVTEGNSANITAAGLVLSEFFLSVAKENDPYNPAAGYEYTPVFDEKTIHALMLAMLGEEQYADLSMQATVFIQMFNNMFLPVLEDIASERGIAILDGKIDNFYISVYKAYLATLLLGSDMGEYFYKVATRVFAQYTIFDSLASASGDYATYLAYINAESSDETGKINKFKYSTFHELAMYENMFAGNKNPTFTMNFESVLKSDKFYGKDVTYKELNDDGYKGIDSNLIHTGAKLDAAGAKKLMENKDNFNKMLNSLNSVYSSVYNSGGRISDTNVTGTYCFMLDVYWSIRQAIGEDEDDPIYLDIYRQYMFGEIKRWDVVTDQILDSSANFIPEKDMNELLNTIQKFTAYFELMTLYFPDYANMEIEEGANLSDMIKSVNASAPVSVAKSTFFNTTEETKFKKAWNCVFNDYNLYELFGGGLQDIVDESKEGNTDSWNILLDIRESLSIMIEELDNVKLISGSGYVEGKSDRGYRSPNISDALYENATSALSDFYYKIDEYISTQEKIDRAYKASITFTLAQFGKNYVTDGYTFEFENKKYTMRSTASSEALAEYVYGGAFLAKFGVAGRYTSSDYHGFIENYKVYDSEDKAYKTKLNVWPELRTYASEMANYTARLYYLSNLNDLSHNVDDGIKLTDIINQGTAEDSTNAKQLTLEYKILEYLITKSDISADTLIRLMFGDSTSTLEDLGCTNKEILSLAYYLDGINYKINSTGDIVKGDNGMPVIVVDGTEYEMTGKNKKEALSKYLELVYSDSSLVYNSFGYYNDGTNTPAERVHIIFKKVISYLVVSEEAEESASEKALNLDNITFKEFKKILIKALSDYQKNPSETDLENANRYISLFNLICAQFEYTYSYTKVTKTDSNGNVEEQEFVPSVDAGTSIGAFYTVADANGVIKYHFKDINGREYDADLYGEFSIDTSTRDIILTLAGVENRPIEELVGLEYDLVYDRGGNYDEANGDVFVICTYDESEGTFFPVIGRNSKSYLTDTTNDYIRQYGINFRTSYYGTEHAYPIIAKGVIDATGNPTAIRIVNNSVQFYRTNITASTSLGEDAMSMTREGGELTTIGYTKYTSGFWSALFNGDKQAMYVGNSSTQTMLKTSGSYYLIQATENYSISSSEVNFDEISVLDKFSAFYTLEQRQMFLFLIGFSTLIPILFKSSFTISRRTLDMIFLIIAAPMAMSTTALSDQGNGEMSSQAFNNWKDNMTKTALHVFGYIIGFNVYYILTSTILQMELVSDSTMDAIYKVGGLSRFVTKNGLNSIISLIFVVGAGAAIETSSNLLVNIVTAGKVDKAFESPMGGDVFTEVKQVVTQVKDSLDRVKNVVNGKAIMQLKDAAIEGLKNTIPGAQLASKIHQKLQNHKSKKQGKELEKAAIANGLSKEMAKRMSDQFVTNEMKQRDAKRKKRAENANAFMKTIGGDSMLGNPNYKAQEDGALKSRLAKQEKGKKAKGKTKKRIDKKNKKKKK